MTQQSDKALIIIDPQNDYFPEGKFPLWNTDNTLEEIKKAIESARQQEMPIVLVQHIASSDVSVAPFF